VDTTRSEGRHDRTIASSFFESQAGEPAHNHRSEPVSRLRKRCGQARTSLVRTSSTIGKHQAGCSKRPSSKAAASEEAGRTLRYVEPLSDTTTTLADFFIILLERPIRRRRKSLQFRREPREATQQPPLPHVHDDRTPQRSQPGGPRPR
jgi:hypothetical protein